MVPRRRVSPGGSDRESVTISSASEVMAIKVIASPARQPGNDLGVSRRRPHSRDRTDEIRCVGPVLPKRLLTGAKTHRRVMSIITVTTLVFKNCMRRSGIRAAVDSSLVDASSSVAGRRSTPIVAVVQGDAASACGTDMSPWWRCLLRAKPTKTRYTNCGYAL
jgi:hypothetical protein